MKKTLFALAGLLVLPATAQAYDPYAPNDYVREQRSAPVRPRLKTYELIIRNHTDSAIVSVQAKNRFMQNLSVDLIPNYTIKPGRQGLVNLYDPDNETCRWYVKTTDEEGVVRSQTLDVCETTVLHLNP